VSSREVPRPPAARVRTSARAAVLLALLLTVLMLAISPLRALLVARDELDGLRRQARVLEVENAALQDRISDLRDPSYLERLARECLGMVRPGETAFVTVPEDGPPPASADC
jgi:cell division protein DivIC